MKKFFIILSVLVVATALGGCLNLDVILPFLNKPPVIISDPIITAIEDQLYSYQVEASDPNGDTLTYSSIVKPEGMNIDSENGLMIWTPTNEQVGINLIEVEISDGKLSVTQSFEIEVSNVNNPPQIFSYFPGSLNVVVNEGDSIKFEIQAHDMDSETTFSFRWFLDGELVLDSTDSGDDSKSSWIYSSSYGDYSQKIIKILVSDGELEDYIQWNVVINDINPPAQLTLGTVLSPTNVSPQTLSGTKESNTSIWINNIEIIPINSSTTWTYDFDLSEGENNISITSCDAAGNESTAITATIVLDTINPAVPTLNAVISPTNVSSQILSGTKEVNTSILINGSEVVPINSEATWSYSLHLIEGTNCISVTSCDAAGNESFSVSTIIVLDTGAPAAPTLGAVISPTNVSSQTLSGTKESNASIWINGAEVVLLNSSTTWTYDFNLSEGANNISITSCDVVGNESSAVTATIEYDLDTYVDIGNTSGTEDGTETHPFNSITEGIEAVISGKSVIVAAGTYDEQLIINKEITLQGASQVNTFITGSNLTGNLISLEADNITISGFTIDGGSSTSVGIYFDNRSFININDNLIKNNNDYGISYINSAPIIEDNTINDNSSCGIMIATNGAGIIRNNSIVSNLYGIRTYGDSCPEIRGNNISNNDIGIYCRESATPIISYNTISNNTGYGILIDDVSDNTVKPDIGGGDGQSDGQNKIVGNGSYGVRNKTDRNVMAKNNWWGDANGPKYPADSSSSGDWAFWSGADSEIIFTPYLTTEP